MQREMRLIVDREMIGGCMIGRLGVHRTLYFVYGSMRLVFSYFLFCLCVVSVFSCHVLHSCCSRFLVFLHFSCWAFSFMESIVFSKYFHEKIAKDVLFPKHRRFLKF
jgi:hypothetical protein